MALASPYGDYVPPNPLLRFWRIHALAQSPLYRPGEEVRFVLFARVFDRADDLPAPDWMPLAHDNLRVRVLDGRGRVVHSLQARTNAHGSVDGAFTLPAEAALGEYTVEADAAALESPAMAPAFRVASFRPPDFGVNLSAPASRPKNLPGERLPDVEVDAAYLSGAGMPGAPVSLAIRRSVVPFAPPRLDGYKTGYNADPFSGRFHYDYIDSRDRTENVAELAAVLDGDGRAAIPLPALDAEPGRTAKISLEATVTDAAGLAGQDAADFLLHPSAFYVGIRGPRFLPAGQEAVLEFKAASWDDRPLSGVDVRVTAERYVGNETDGPLWEKSLKLAGPEGEKLPVSFEKSGQYCISAFITDPQGRENVSRFMLMVPGAFLEWLRVRPGTDLELVADEEEYSPGQSAKIAVNSPFEQGLALISVERDSVLRYELREISGPSPVLIVPLTAAEAPYVFVSVTLIRGRTAPPPQGADFGGREDAGAPRVAFGAVCLPVSADEPGLLVSLEADAAEYRPGGTVTVTAGVAGDPDRKPRQSQVTLLAVDERVLLAAGGADGYDPGKTFTRLRSHGIRNADTRTRLLDLALPMQRNMDSALPRTAAPLREISAGPPLRDEDGALRQDFSPLVFWLAQGRTDERGRLTASFSLPDTLTSYRLVAVAAGDGRQFATAGLSVRAGKPLQLLSAMPRFATQGDRLLARVLVQNMGASPGEALVHAEAEGAVLGENSASVPLDAGESGVASFPLSVSEAGNALLRVRGSLGKESDAAEFVLPVKPAAPLAATAASGLLRSGESRVLPVLPPSPLDGRSRLEVVFAPSPAVGMPAAAREILDYPWECLEQRLTKAWARSLRLRHGDLLGLPADPADEENIRIALDSASQFQQPDGGLSLWPGSHSSSFYLTAYALLVHSRLETAALSPEVAAEARRYLAGQLEKHAGLSPGEREPSITAEALALLVLAESDSYAAQRRFHNVLEAAEAMRGCSPMAWGCLLLAAGALPDAPGLQRRILSSLEKTAAVTPGHLHFAAAGHASYGASMGSDLRDNGLVLAALTRTAPDYPRIDALASWIGQGLGETRRLSTQEGIFGLWGLTDYLTSLGGNRPVTLQAVWNQRDAMTKTFSRVTDPPFVWVLGADKLPAGQSAELALTARQGDPLWTARLLSAPPSAPAFPENAGFTVARRWNRPPPWNMGDVVEVELTLVVPATRRHVLLFDPFPAGLEPLRATRVDLAEEAPARQPIRPIWEREETRDDGVLLYASSLDPGVYTYSYKLRAAAPGVFVQRAASVEEMYSPEVFGRSAGSVVRVNESEHALRQ
jgi:uncharacterized protein YfaS (alpha-2-macroglobulin family)